jgi:hypothetical protein
MKNNLVFLSLFIFVISFTNVLLAKNVEREVATFSEVALRIPAIVHIEQGETQRIEIVAKSTTVKEIITEVKGRTLNIKFPNERYFWKKFEPGKIEIFITVPEIDGLSVSGSGDIVADEIDTRILELAVSGSGDIVIDELKTKRVSCTISGSGDITIKDGGVADDFSVSISGSGDVKAIGFEASDVVVRVSGSGNCSIASNGSIKARVAGSGNINYKGNPSIDSSVAGSGRVKKM